MDIYDDQAKYTTPNAWRNYGHICRSNITLTTNWKSLERVLKDCNILGKNASTPSPQNASHFIFT